MLNLHPLIYVVVPCHNDYLHTRESIGVLLKSDYPNFQVTLVDDGSTDGTARLIKEEYPSVKILKGDGNLWWSGSMNLGIADALSNKAEYIFVLNNDVLVASDALSNLVACAIIYPDAIIGSMVYDLKKPNVIWNGGGILKWPWPGEVQLGMGESDFGQFEGIIQRDWSPGMGTLIPRHVLEKTNSYDFKNMPQYLADVDLCLRAKRLGHPLYITSNSKLYNHVENTGGLSKQGRLSWSQIKFIFTSFRSGEYLRARITFIWRHSPIYLVLPSLIVRYFRLLVYILRP